MKPSTVLNVPFPSSIALRSSASGAVIAPTCPGDEIGFRQPSAAALGAAHRVEPRGESHHGSHVAQIATAGGPNHATTAWVTLYAYRHSDPRHGVTDGPARWSQHIMLHHQV